MAHSILTECSSRQYKDVLVHTLNSYFLFSKFSTCDAMRMRQIYFLSPERKTPRPPVTTDKGTRSNPARTPAGKPMKGTETSFANKA